ncbi:MAG: porin family protein [Rhodospirillaceae bacterium]|nr:porin family protein [Rhodospirillaceae bacterium]
MSPASQFTVALALTLFASTSLAAQNATQTTGQTTGQTRGSSELPADPVWYFVGGGSTTADGAGRNTSNREPYRDLDNLVEVQFRHEFSLTLGAPSSAPEMLAFASGQSYGVGLRSRAYTFLVNRTFEWQNTSPITPHFMAGLGVTYSDDGDRQSGGFAFGSQTDGVWKPALQLGVGASYAVNESWAFTAQYRAFYLGPAARDLVVQQDGHLTQNFMVGARFRF